MTEEELRSFSVTQMKQLIDVKNKINLIFENNTEIIKLRNGGYTIEFDSLDERFEFIITNIQPKKENPNGELFCRIRAAPTSLSTIALGVIAVNLKEASSKFLEWVKNVKAYNEVLNEYFDPFYNQFEKEYEDEFGFADAEDDTTTLNSENQLKMYKLLGAIESKIFAEDQSNPEIEKLLTYTKDFKENLHKLPKSIIKRKAIQLLSKMRRAGIKLFHDTVEMGYKELIKLALHSGADGIQHVMHNL